MQNPGHADGRPRKHNFDINKIDYEWIEKTTKISELKLAYDALEEDGYFPDLLKVLGERIVSLDPQFARRIGAGASHVSAEEAAALNSELNDFFADASKTDEQLRGAVPHDDAENSSIFSNGIAVPKDVVSPVAEQIEKRQAAENERLKGNECVKAKEYSEAVACYSRSLSLHGDEPFTYANRAMAYLKMKDYRKAIDDANTALKLKPGYIKAYHRRGKAHAALNEHELAIKDFQTILESEPENKEVNKDLMAARTLLNDKLKKDLEKEQKKKKSKGKNNKKGKESEAKAKDEPVEKKKFVRVAIEEDSDEEEEGDEDAGKASSPVDTSKASDEPIIEEVSSTTNSTGTKWWPKQETKEARQTKTVTSITSKFPLKNAKEMIEHAREAKKLMQKGGDDFMKKFNEREKQKAQSAGEESVEDEKEKLKELEETQKKLEQELAEQREAEAEAKRAKEKAETARREKAKKEKEELELKKKKEEEARKEKEAKEAEAAQKKAQEEAEKAKAEAAAKKEQSKASSEQTSQLTPAQQAKYEKQKPKVDNVLQKVETKKATAAEAFKLGQYGDAIKSYKAAVQVLESASEDFPLFKKEISQMEATIFNNMAACSRKELNSKAEIEYSTKVIDLQEYISDKTVLLKAFLRRGLAYEQVEKYLQAKEDMLSVKELQSDNKQASQCLNRVQKAIKDVYGSNVPEVKKNKPIKMATATETRTPSPVKEKEEAAEPTKETPKEAPKEDKDDEDEEKPPNSAGLSSKFTEIKDAGNDEYKRKMWVMAIAKFGEGIGLYQKNRAMCDGDSDLKTKVAQLYTNRALSWHQLDNQDDVIKDCTYVLKELDSKNPKALFRRSHAYRSKERWYEAVQDLEQLMKVDPNNKQAKKDLIQAKTKVKEYESQPKPKIQEVSSGEAAAEASPEPEAKKGEFSSATSAPEPKKPKQTKMLDKETVDKASSIATDQATQAALKNIPKTAAGLEKDYNQLKRDSELVHKYLKQVPIKTVEQLYKKTEVPTEVLAGILAAMANHGLSNKEACKHTCQFLISIAKADNFEMTQMFMEDPEQKLLAKILEGVNSKLKGDQLPKALAKAFNL